jgi:hypothetical protein
MEFFSNNLPIYSLNHRKPKINPRPQYQRGPVWSEKKQQLLLDSIMRGYDIPKIYLKKNEDGSEYEHDVVDGQQRLGAIWAFMANQFSLPQESEDIPDSPPLNGKFYKDFESNLKDKFGSYIITITEIQKATDLEIRELFLRLQEGESLTPPEKRNAMIGNMRDFIAEKVVKFGDSIFASIGLDNRRYERDDWVAHITMLELNGGPMNLKADDLKRLYKNNENFDKEGAVAQKIIKCLNFMKKMLQGNELPELKIKWGFVDLYWLVSSLIENYKITNRNEDFFLFYRGFESERRAVTDPAELIEGVHSDWDRELYDYISAFQREGAKRNNLEIRHTVYMKSFLKEYPDLVPKDPNRIFDDNQRIVIWRRDNKSCQLCSNSVVWEDLHIDHITPHSEGGETSIENGRATHSSCNQARGNRI